MTFRNSKKALKIDNYSRKILFQLLHELQKIEINKKNLYDLFGNSHTLKNQLDMCFPETTSQPVERRAFGNWKSRCVKNCIKKGQKLFAKFLNDQNEI